MSLITMRGFDAYGLRAAKKIVRDVRAEVNGETGLYAKGFRDALRHVEMDISIKLDEIKSIALGYVQQEVKSDG